MPFRDETSRGVRSPGTERDRTHYRGHALATWASQLPYPHTQERVPWAGHAAWRGVPTPGQHHECWISPTIWPTGSRTACCLPRTNRSGSLPSSCSPCRLPCGRSKQTQQGGESIHSPSHDYRCSADHPHAETMVETENQRRCAVSRYTTCDRGDGLSRQKHATISSHVRYPRAAALLVACWRSVAGRSFFVRQLVHVAMDFAELSPLVRGAGDQHAVFAAALDSTPPVFDINHSFCTVLRAVARATLDMSKVRVLLAAFGGARLGLGGEDRRRASKTSSSSGAV